MSRFYGYQFAKANSYIRFTQRAQALNLVIYWATSILGSLVMGILLDHTRVSRRLRARYAWLLLCLLTIPIWSGGSIFQAKTESYINRFLLSHYSGPVDVASSSYYGPAALFLFYGLHSAVWQVTSYWVIGCLTNDDRVLANYAGFSNAAQSAGNAVIWRLVSPGAYVVGVSERSVYDAIFALAIASLLISAPTFFLGVRDDECSARSIRGVPAIDEQNTQAVVAPDGVATVSGDRAAVALPRRAVHHASKTRWYTMPKIATCAFYALVTVMVLLPVGLAALGTVVNTGFNNACLPDGTFSVPGSFNVWAFSRILTLTVGSGHMTFATAKLVDLIWDIGVGHGGQALLVWFAGKVFTRYIVCLMEHQGVTTRTYTAATFYNGSLRGVWMLLQDLFKRKTFTITRNLGIMVYVAVYLLIFPAVISAMTSYAPIGDPFVTVDLSNGSGYMTLPFEHFSLVNRTNGTWLYRDWDSDYQRNFSTATILAQAACKQSNYFRFGFSYLLLFIFCVASSIFAILLVILKDHNGLANNVHRSGCHSPGLWRSVMDLSSHARSVTAGEDMEHLQTEQLEQQLDGTRMAFDADDLAAVRSTVVAAAEASAMAAKIDKDEKHGLRQRTKAVWHRRKRSMGFKVYESPPTAYEGV